MGIFRRKNRVIATGEEIQEAADRLNAGYQGTADALIERGTSRAQQQQITMAILAAAALPPEDEQ